MIKKLRNKIFFILMVSISIVVVGTITIFAIVNYNNTLNIASSSLDRFSKVPEKPEKPDKDAQELQKDDLNVEDLNIESFNLKSVDSEYFSIDSSNIYYCIVEKDDSVTSVSDINDEIKKYALEVSKKNKQTGTIGNYIFKTRNGKDGSITVYLMEDTNAINRLKTIYFLAIGASFISVIVIYIISKLVSNLIVKPVEETIEKQKQFISDASHELKTPLAVIEANADVIENEQGRSKWLTYIQNEIESMNKLINELLLLAKIENVDSLILKEEFDISQEAEMITSMFESMAYEKKVKIETNIQKNIKMIGTKEDIEHILSTLIDNAIKHTKENNKIEVELKKEKENIIIKVKNEGEPIPKDERNKIFERFYRVDKARNRNEKRYGLGLAIAKSIVEKYKGTIEVNCENGITTFKVLL